MSENYVYPPKKEGIYEIELRIYTRALAAIIWRQY